MLLFVMKKEQSIEKILNDCESVWKDDLGSYIRATGILKKDEYLDLSRATKLNRSSSVRFCCGIPGGGHSVRAH
ncbi:hypothetical protein [Clostridium sulfidigenes]|uniref:hypothetical protein n=1 Tax=Clostridium sulfidigenes TaxID=318464 RepID=UPI003F88EF6C